MANEIDSGRDDATTIAPAHAPSVGGGVFSADDSAPRTPDGGALAALNRAKPYTLDELLDLPLAAPGAAEAFVSFVRGIQERADVAERRVGILVDRLGETRAPATTRRGVDAPEGMTVYVRVSDVMKATGWKKSKAADELRKALAHAGHVHKDGETLRVAVEEWETYDAHARGVGKGKMKWDQEARRGTTSAKEAASGTGRSTSTMRTGASIGSNAAPAARRKRQLGPFSPGGSKREPIPIVMPRQSR